MNGKIIIYLVGIALCLIAREGRGQGGERILEFHSDITVNVDSSLSVVETIKVLATGNQIKRGIYRDFPTLYTHSWGLRRARGFSVDRVLRDGKPENYVLEDISGGKRVKIGRGNVLLKRGEYTYQIHYQTTRQLGYFDEHDELYWNVTGNGWGFTIEKASATVRLPNGAVTREVSAYTGATGSKAQAFRREVRPGGAIYFESTAPLYSGEGLTLVVTWQKGLVDYTADPQGVGAMIKDNIGAAIGVFGLLGVIGYFYLIWAKVGKDPELGTIIPLYEPPPGFSPAAVRYLYEMGFDDKVFTAAIIGLASKGYLSINQKGKTYTLTLTESSAELAPDELALYQKLFSRSGSLVLKQKNHARIGGAKTELKKKLSKKLEQTYFVKNIRYWVIGLLMAVVPLGISVGIQAPEALFILLWLTIWSAGTMLLVSAAISAWKLKQGAIGTTLFAIPFTLAWFGGVGAFVVVASPIVAVIFAISAILVVVFYHLLKAPTHYGREVLDQVEGFRQYLSVAEADRLNLVNPPKRTPELFEKFLPYALALGVDQEWSEQFSEVLSAASRSAGDRSRGYSPSFYTGNSSLNQLSAGALTSAIAGSLTSALASSSVSPSSSSGGGGGGSSGGGGGGGGGGGW
ncbi:MAG: DUF2207 domain-containing protein [Verrucomicrobiales bacterium]|nr:DUF2207 domain-containing protein [Verrucomicrobiales bacterium]